MFLFQNSNISFTSCVGERGILDNLLGGLYLILSLLWHLIISSPMSYSYFSVAFIPNSQLPLSLFGLFYFSANEHPLFPLPLLSNPLVGILSAPNPLLLKKKVPVVLIILYFFWHELVSSSFLCIFRSSSSSMICKLFFSFLLKS